MRHATIVTVCEIKGDRRQPYNYLAYGRSLEIAQQTKTSAVRESR